MQGIRVWLFWGGRGGGFDVSFNGAPGTSYRISFNSREPGRTLEVEEGPASSICQAGLKKCTLGDFESSDSRQSSMPPSSLPPYHTDLQGGQQQAD